MAAPPHAHPPLSLSLSSLHPGDADRGRAERGGAAAVRAVWHDDDVGPGEYVQG